MQVQDYRQELESRKAKLEVLESNIESHRALIEDKERDLEDHVKARWLLSEASKRTQENVKVRIETLGTMAIQSVFDDRDFKLLANFEIKRNKSECTLMVQEGDNEPSIPKNEMGGSIVDLLSFSLRVILWSMENPRSRNVFGLDEPFHFLGHGEELLRAGRIVRELSEKLGFQVLIITHEPELAEIGNKIWAVVHNGVHSVVVEVVKGNWENKTWTEIVDMLNMVFRRKGSEVLLKKELGLKGVRKFLEDSKTVKKVNRPSRRI